MTEEPNIDYILNLAGDNKVFQQQFIDIIKEELPIESQTYLENMVQSNFRAASEDVHKLKHKINILGLAKSYEVAAKHEEELRDGNPSSKADFVDILNAMQAFINTI